MINMSMFCHFKTGKYPWGIVIDGGPASCTVVVQYMGWMERVIFAVP